MKYPRVLGAGIISGSLILVLSGVAGSQILSTDEMLEYGVTSIRSSVAEAFARNQQAASRNALLRQDIQGLKHELKKEEHQLLSVQQQNASLVRQTTAASGQSQTPEDRLAQLRKQKQQLEQEQKTLRDMLSLRSGELQQFQEQVQAMEVEPVLSQRKGDSPPSPLSLDDKQDDAAQLRDMIQASRDHLKNQKDELGRLTRQAKKRRADQESAVTRRQDLEQEIAQWQKRLGEEAAREVVLRRFAVEFQEDALMRSGRDSDALDDRRRYRDELSDSLNPLKGFVKTVRAQWRDDEAQMHKAFSLLKEQNEGLLKYCDVLEAGLVLSRDDHDEEADHEAILDERRQEMLVEQGRLRDDLEQIRSQINEQRQINLSIKKDEASLNREIGRLDKKVRKAQRSAALIRKKTFGRTYTRVEKALDQQRLRVDDLNLRLAEVKQQWGVAPAAGNDLDFKEDQIREEISRLQALTEEAEFKNQELTQTHQQLAQANEVQMNTIQEEIQQAEMRKKALAASVDVVRQKFDAEKDGRLCFSSEQEELTRYLDVLKQENQALQKKMRDLQDM